MTKESERRGESRRKEVRRDDDRAELARVRAVSHARSVLLLLCVLIIPLLMIRSGIIDYPSWMPLWVIYPEGPISRFFSPLFN